MVPTLEPSPALSDPSQLLKKHSSTTTLKQPDVAQVVAAQLYPKVYQVLHITIQLADIPKTCTPEIGKITTHKFSGLVTLAIMIFLANTFSLNVRCHYHQCSLTISINRVLVEQPSSFHQGCTANPHPQLDFKLFYVPMNGLLPKYFYQLMNIMVSAYDGSVHPDCFDTALSFPPNNHSASNPHFTASPGLSASLPLLLTPWLNMTLPSSLDSSCHSWLQCWCPI
jgi:hypothetical protein